MIKDTLFVAAIATGLIAWDHASGPIFPDSIYCAIGAGTATVVGGETNATSWSANDGCTAYRPECATSWRTSAIQTVCVHGTIWDAYKIKLRIMDN